MFEKCCGSKEFHKCTYVHNPKPLDIDITFQNVINYLLWYSPQDEIAYQRIDNSEAKILKSKILSEFLIKRLIELLKLDYEKDVLFYDEDKIDLNIESIISELDLDSNINGICLNCSKFIIRYETSNSESSKKNGNKYKYSKSEQLFREIRHSIAHGSFTVNGDYFIGRNSYRGKTLSVFKFKISDFSKIVNMIISSDLSIQILEEKLKHLKFIENEMINLKGIVDNPIEIKVYSKMNCKIIVYKHNEYVNLKKSPYSEFVLSNQDEESSKEIMLPTASAQIKLFYEDVDHKMYFNNIPEYFNIEPPEYRNLRRIIYHVDEQFKSFNYRLFIVGEVQASYKRLGINDKLFKKQQDILLNLFKRNVRDLVKDVEDEDSKVIFFDSNEIACLYGMNKTEKEKRVIYSNKNAPFQRSIGR